MRYVSSEAATVMRVAATGTLFQQFFQIPIFDHAQTYQLYQVHRLPRIMHNTSVRVVFSNLPDYFAISRDLDTFIELSSLNTERSRQLGGTLCRFHTGLK